MRTLFLVVAVSAGLAWAAAVTTTSHAGSPATPSGSAGVAVSPTTQSTLSVQVEGTAIKSVTLVAWCYSSGTWGRLPAFDLDLGGSPERVAGRPPESPGFLTSAPLPIPPSCSRLYWQTLEVRPLGLSHTVTVSLTAQVSSATCGSVVVGVSSCGTTPAPLPSTRTGGSTSLEITNSPENAGSPKVKCLPNPADGGVGFGATYPGIVRSPGESAYFGLDSSHTIICVCDTPGTAITTTECAP